MILQDFKRMSWTDLKSKLSEDPNYEANLELARRVVNNYQMAVNYYIGPLSEKIVSRINYIMGENSYGEYYEFISEPYEDTEDGKKPCWHKVSLYDAKDCKLQTYTSTIACRYFYKQANKRKKLAEKNGELLEYVDYEALLGCDKPEEDSETPMIKRMRNAYEQLNERDKLVLKLLVMEKQSAIEAYPYLEAFIHPIARNGKTSDEIKAGWSLKQKQDAISLIKGRALHRLQKQYNKLTF